MADGLQGFGRLVRRVHKLATDSRHVERAMDAAGAYMLGSIEQNFRAQGRPEKWKGLAASTLAARARRGKRRRKAATGSAQILIDKARLKNSINYKVIGGGTGVAIGTNVVYARRHQLGFPKGKGRGHSFTPARPFLLFQDEDIKYIGSNIFGRHIRGR